jgi:putative phosphoribosyl transferase
MFRDRVDAGRWLAGHLEPYRGAHVLVLGVARGGMPVAAEVARALEADLDVVVARKLGAPGQPELAIGAVTANGGRYVNEEYVRELRVTDAYLQAEIERKSEEARAREAWMRGLRPELAIEGRTVIVVDDGLATGATMRAALRSVRRREPARLVMAAPVGSRDACAAMTEEADEVVCPRQPSPFFAVGLYYEDFGATSDDEVRRLLEEAHAERPARASSLP